MRTLAVLAGILLAISPGARALDRYRCTPADGGESYTSPGTCRSTTDTRTPLTQEEVADLEQDRRRGRPFYRCTAADGSYSKFVPSGQCPSATDTLTVEYARQAIQQPRPAPPERVPVDPPVSRAAAVPRPPEPSATPVQGSQAIQAAPGGGLGRIAALALLAATGVAIWSWRRSSLRAAGSPEPRQRPTRPRPAAAAQRPSSPAPTRTDSAPTTPRPDMDATAREFLAALQAGADLPGGLAFRNALQQAQLDFSVDSLDRVDRLLGRIKREFSPDRENWSRQPGTENFRLLLAFYLGEMVSRQARQPIKWYSRDQAVFLMPPDMPLPEASWARVVGIIAASACVPLGVIEEALFDDTAPTPCKAYVERTAARLPKPPPRDENERCAQMLEAFFSGSGILGTLALREQLEHSRLDYTLASLERVDQLLRSIRDEIKPDYKGFINETPTQNFVRFVAFYIGMTTARVGNIAVKWLDFAEARKELPELDFAFESTSVCLLGGRFCFVLGLVTEILFHPEPARTVSGWARAVLEQPADRYVSILRGSASSEVANPLDAAMARAVERAGFVAAWCMFMVAGGSVGHPTVFVPGPDGQGGSFTDFGMFSSLDAGFAAARDQMERNPHRAAFQVMTHDAYANLPTGRTDALSVELRLYRGDPVTRGLERFDMTVLCPYRHADDPRGFAIHSPKLIECSAGPDRHGAIFQQFYRGLADFKAADFDWFKYLDESI